MKYFTVATNPNDPRYLTYATAYADDSPVAATNLCLIFGDSSIQLDLENVQYHKDIAYHPLTRELLGSTFIIIPMHYRAVIRYTTCEQSALVATRSLTSLFSLQQLAKLTTHPVTVVTPNEVITQNMSEFYRQCSLPEKYIHGCAECPALLSDSHSYDPSKLCLPCRTFYNFSSSNYSLKTYQDFLKRVSFNKTKIGDFLATGGSTTSMDTIAPAVRHITQHHFQSISDNQQIRQQAAHTQKCNRAIQDKLCPSCAMAYYCDSGAHKHCSQHYPYTDYQLARQIIDKVHNPFTEAQMQYLLEHSGELEKRLNRFIYVASLSVQDKLSPISNIYVPTLQFTLHPKYNTTATHITSTYNTTNFTTAKRWLDQYMPSQKHFRVDKSVRLKAPKKACILELAATTHSPLHHNGWRSTAYPLYYISSISSNAPVVATFFWNSQKSTLPWTLTAYTPQDIFGNFGFLFFCDGQQTEYHKREF